MLRPILTIVCQWCAHAQADDQMSMIGFEGYAGGMVRDVQVGDQGEGSLIGDHKIYRGLARGAGEGVRLGVGTAVQDGAVAFLQTGECQLPLWVKTGSKLDLLAAM